MSPARIFYSKEDKQRCKNVRRGAILAVIPPLDELVRVTLRPFMEQGVFDAIDPRLTFSEGIIEPLQSAVICTKGPYQPSRKPEISAEDPQ